jgi:hypothetical protein
MLLFWCSVFDGGRAGRGFPRQKACFCQTNKGEKKLCAAAHASAHTHSTALLSIYNHHHQQTWKLDGDPDSDCTLTPHLAGSRRNALSARSCRFCFFLCNWGWIGRVDRVVFGGQEGRASGGGLSATGRSRPPPFQSRAPVLQHKATALNPSPPLNTPPPRPYPYQPTWHRRSAWSMNSLPP